jgi:molybdopterin molybdotransferase
MLSYEEARRRVIEVVSARRKPPQTERMDLQAALGRVLAEEIVADRDYPPFDRSTRDGYSVRADAVRRLPALLEVVAEIKAGDSFSGKIGPGQCAQIMTGAAVPAGTDSVVMLEHVIRENDRITLDKPVELGQNVIPQGSEAIAGQILLKPGAQLGYAELALLGQVGHASVFVSQRPRVAILSTGDEVVEVSETPGAFQIRNSNTVSLVAQVMLAGGEPVPLRNAPDEKSALRQQMERGLQEDVLVLSGGVSMGKHDLVEDVLRELGAEFFFDAVAIRPGRPAVFGYCRDKPVFGLPGNPVSTMVTFELFVVPALDLLSGDEARPLQTYKARLSAPVKQKSRLSHFLPAKICWDSGEAEVKELPWQGSGDIVALANANCFLVVPEKRLEMEAGDWVDVLPRRGII